MLQEPTLGGKPLDSWKITTLPFKDVSWAKSFKPSKMKIHPPAIYIGELVLPPNTDPLDTYIDPTGWGKVRRISIHFLERLGLEGV